MRSSRRSSELKHRQIVLLGAAGVGKTCLLHRFLSGSCPKVYCPTIEDSHSYLIHLPDGSVESISFLDTAGLHQFPAMRRLYIDGGSAFLIVFAVDNIASLEAAACLADEVRSVKGPNVPLVVAANKADDDSVCYDMTSLAQALANGEQAITETSALIGRNVQLPFAELLKNLFGDVSVMATANIKDAAAGGGGSLRRASFCFKLTPPNAVRRRQSDEDSETTSLSEPDDVIVPLGLKTFDSCHRRSGNNGRCVIC